jgi:Bacteriophage HK97-gp10, putative tail-component
MPKPAFSFELVGFKEIQAKLAKLADPHAIDDAAEAAVTAAGRDFRDKLKAAAPEASQYYPEVPKGYLREHIDLKIGKIKGVWTAFIGPDPKTYYPDRQSTVLTKTGKVRKKALKHAKAARGPWMYLVGWWMEFGQHKHKQPARPWLAPTFKNNVQRINNSMMESLRKWVAARTR